MEPKDVEKKEKKRKNSSVFWGKSEKKIRAKM